MTGRDRSAGWEVSLVERRVAERLCALVDETDRRVLLAAMLAAAAPAGGHVCVDLADVGPTVTVAVRPPDLGWVGTDEPGFAEDGAAGAELGPDDPDADQVARGAPVTEETWEVPVDRDAWLGALEASGVARPSHDDLRTAPLVVDGTRVYLDRYWAYEERLRGHVVARSVTAAGDDEVALVREVLGAVAPAGAPDPLGPASDRQRLAVANALLRRLSVISGGPGTGKTHTVVSALVGHLERARRRGTPPPRIALAAPTGKAAARLEEAIREAVVGRDLDPEHAEALRGLRAVTLHRLLGHQRRTPTRFRHHAGNPLPHDVVIVDEASMVALSMVAKLVDAVAPDATLVLVGDRDQLASVEAGAVLGDVCGPVPAGSSLRLSDGWATVLGDATGEPVAADRARRDGPGVWDGIVQLERFHRFGPTSGIGAVARAIQAVTDDGAHVVELLTGLAVEDGATVDRYGDVALVQPDRPALPASLRDVVLAGLVPYVEAAVTGDAVTALARLDDVRLLCATRRGPLGVAEVGQVVEAWVRAADERLGSAEGGWYVGRPVMVTRNDHDLGLMNGDVGVTVSREGRTVVAFPRPDGTLREVPTVRVVDCETVWAMTIHKSQGSQFRHAIVVLPTTDNQVVSRELVYTGVTRARDRVTVVATEDVLRRAVTRPVRRATGLADRLWS